MWTLLPEVAKASRELAKCGCKAEPLCSRKCKCHLRNIVLYTLKSHYTNFAAFIRSVMILSTRDLTIAKLASETINDGENHSPAKFPFHYEYITARGTTAPTS